MVVVAAARMIGGEIRAWGIRRRGEEAHTAGNLKGSGKRNASGKGSGNVGDNLDNNEKGRKGCCGQK